MEMFRGKFKALFFVLWKGEDLGKILLTDGSFYNKNPATFETSLLIQAACHNDTFIARVITGLPGFRIELSTCDEYPTALHAAAACNSVETLKVLLGVQGADVNLSEQGSDTPLIYAARNNSTEAVIELLSHKEIDVNLIRGGVSALMAACESGALESIKVLCRAEGIDKNLANSDGVFFLLKKLRPISVSSVARLCVVIFSGFKDKRDTFVRYFSFESIAI
jgi:ankyrin repeat protein